MDCASYLSRSGLTFNGCFKAKRGELMVSKGLYQLYNGPLFDFTARGKITRDIDRMKDLIMRFMREFNINNGLVYYDNFAIRVYDKFRKAVMLEDTPFAEQGHLFIYRLNIPVEFMICTNTVRKRY